MRRPRFIVAQARHANGPFGWLTAWIMARETRRDNLRAIEALELQASDQTLDIGTGHGWALSEMASRSPGGIVTGVDPSDLMVKIATNRNASLVRARRVRVLKAGVEDLPFPGQLFDKAMAVHALYFWPNLDDSLRKIARVLRPGGRLALAFRSAEDIRAVAAFPTDIYRFPTHIEVGVAMRAAGFTSDRIDLGDKRQRQIRVLMTATRYG